MPNLIKKNFVTTLIEKLINTPNFVLINFDKTPHKKLEELRSTLRSAQKNAIKTPLHTVKNSLFKIAAAKINKPEVASTEVLKGSSALLTLPADWSASLSAFYKFAKNEESLRFKVGLIDDKVYLEKDLVKLAELPSKDVLIAKILSSLKAPHVRIVRSMTYNMTTLVYVMKEKGRQVVV